ncbi:MAG: glycosyltransferase family 2 protein [Patescibacteria group bacterium]
MSRKAIKTSIIIVYHSKIADLVGCLKSIFKYPLKKSFEIIIVDNSNDKKTSKKISKLFPQVKYIKSAKNVGYGAGNNLGVKNCLGEYILILNPDTRFIDNSVNKLVDFLDSHNKTSIVGPNLVHPNGVVFSQLGSRELTPIRGIFALSILNRIFPNNPISKSYWLFDTRLDVLRQVDVVPGSGLLIRKKIFISVGGFDENFFLYFEESDLAKRIQQKYPTTLFYINPDAQIQHNWKPKDPGTKQSNQIFVKSRYYYFKKHFGLLSALLVEFFCRLNKYTLLLAVFISICLVVLVASIIS